MKAVKVYNAKNRISSNLKKAIENTIKFHEKYKGCFNWNYYNGNEQMRSSKIAAFEKDNPAYKIITNEGKIIVEPSLDLSRKNTYYQLQIWLFDAADYLTRSDVRLIKKLINK